jgi:glycosyltransferase involved in cell wall biosynthesis
MRGFQFDRLLLTRRSKPVELGPGLMRLIGASRGHDLIHVHGDAAALACLPLIGTRPTVITLHGSHLLRRGRGMRGRLARTGIRRAFARADTVIAVSESEGAFATEIAPFAARRIVVIHNGVAEPATVSAADRDAIRSRLGVDTTSFVALLVGELSDRKQPKQFADAIAQVRREDQRVVGVIAGDGPLHGQLESRGDDGLLLLGDRDDVHELIAASDAFVLPSLWEGLSYAMLEAMARSVAIVASDGPGNPDAVGESGLIFPAGDVGALAAALLRLAREPALRGRLGKSASTRARELFSLDRMTQATAAVYEGALGRARSEDATIEGSTS